MAQRALTYGVAHAGGLVRVRVTCKGIGATDKSTDLQMSIFGDSLHAPLAERLLELPMDIYDGANSCFAFQCPAFWLAADAQAARRPDHVTTAEHQSAQEHVTSRMRHI